MVLDRIVSIASRHLSKIIIVTYTNLIIMYSVGEFIEVRAQTFVGRPNSDGGVCVIKHIHADRSIDVNYVIDNKLEVNIAPDRIINLNPLVTMARRRNVNDVDRPSILAPSHQPQSTPRTTRPSPLLVSPPMSPSGASKVMIESRGWSKYERVLNPLLVFLREGRKKSKGWLRREENEYDVYEDNRHGKKKGEMKVQLSVKENNKLVHMKMELDRVKESIDVWPTSFTPLADLAYAFGIGHRKIVDCVNVHYSNGCTTKRKVRNDAGRTLFNSQAMRNKFYTPFEYYKKKQRKLHPGERITDQALKEAWVGLSEQLKHECQLGADNLKLVAANIEDVTKTALEKTNGSISWEKLASYIAGGEDKVQPVSKTALARHVMATEGFRYFATRTLPQCNQPQTKKRRLEWAISFHIFWEGAKMIATKVQVVYFHIDEKWFYSLVIRMNNKLVPVWGVQGVWNRIHHKNAIDKILAICAMAFAPIDNDIRKGGRAKKLTITRSGGMKTAQKDTYPRVYNDDGTYCYPKDPDNILRKKGEEYFENWEITGSKKTGKGKSKFALTEWIKDTFMDDLKQH